MKRASTATVAMLIGSLAVICCAAPLIIAAIGTTALAAWLVHSGYVLIAAALLALGGSILWLRYRRMSAQECCQPEVLNKASKDE